jgi:DNA repair protein RadC
MIVATARTAAELLAPHFAEGGEGVAVLHLDDGQRLLATTVAEPDRGAGIDLPIRDIVAAALTAGAASVIVARSHAGGHPAPSEADRAGARLLAEAALAAGIRLADYFIFAGAECRSFRQLGLL